MQMGMPTEQFVILSKSGKLDIKMVVTVYSTGSNMEVRLTEAKNVIFDMLRANGFDVDKIEIQ